MKIRNQIKKQNGIALVICSVVLLVVLLLTISSIQTVKFSKIDAVIFQSNNQAELAADAATREAEQTIINEAPVLTQFTTGCAGGYCLQEKVNNIWDDTASWTNAKQLTTDLQAKSKIQDNPKYLIEYVGDKKYRDSLSVGDQYGSNQDMSKMPIYRVTTKSKGQKGEKETIIQTILY
jgi:Tfp pilus assembly protein PilX